MDFILQVLIIIGIHSILTMSLNYVAGFTGLMSINHAAFYGMGAYATAILSTQYDWNFFLTIPVGIVIAGIVAWLVSFPMLKMKEDSFVLVSLGFAIIMFNIMQNWTDLTKGPLGIKGVQAPMLGDFSFFAKPLFLVLVIVAAALTYWFLNRILKTPYGTILKGARENETVARVNGHNVVSYQRSAFVVGAIFAAIAGAFIASFISFVNPKAFELIISVYLLIMIILGGMASLPGSILGAFIMLTSLEVLRFAGVSAEWQQILYGFILIVIMFFRPQGILGKYKI
ncbi:branched-chain amino acid ABC transporter permease [Candidatus Peregrinibacteria bacterium]|nr:MAG: branched-chain amino acid ABC transporter permease [Candidatus Peregrinibacteria bacterium]